MYHKRGAQVGGESNDLCERTVCPNRDLPWFAQPFLEHIWLPPGVPPPTKVESLHYSHRQMEAKLFIFLAHPEQS